jgi:hypothetical protein
LGGDDVLRAKGVALLRGNLSDCISGSNRSHSDPDSHVLRGPLGASPRLSVCAHLACTKKSGRGFDFFIFARSGLSSSVKL